MKCVFLHVHTTGLDPDVDEVVEFAALPWDDGKVGDMHTDKFRAVGNVPDEAAKINGYNAKERESCATFRAGFVQRILNLIGEHDGVIVANNPDFAWSFIRTAAARRHVVMPRVRVRTIDTASLAVPLYMAGKVPGLSLKDLAVLTGRPYTCSSSAETVTMIKDVFEHTIRRYYGALK